MVEIHGCILHLMNLKVYTVSVGQLIFHGTTLSRPTLVKRKVELSRRQKDKLDDWNEAHEPEGCRFFQV